MADRDDLPLFAALGVEIEYMIVDAESLVARPCADSVLHAVAGAGVNLHDAGTISWTNELARHVIELKTTDPAPSTAGLLGAFHAEVLAVQRELDRLGARLLPGAMHPFMDSAREFQLYPDGDHRIYSSFDRIFGCAHHGWANLQSVHINLPFQGDAEFAALHGAIRLLLPLIPGLSAGSPCHDGRLAEHEDFRLTVYRDNCRRIPSITGQVVPEAIGSIGDYLALLDGLYRDIAPHDPDAVLQEEWLNARGAIARFDRNTIEIRVIDAQESPLADLAVVEIVLATVRRLTESPVDARAQAGFPQAALVALLDQTIIHGDAAAVDDPDYRRLLGLPADGAMDARAAWSRLIAMAAAESQLSADAQRWAAHYQAHGCLARRLRERLGPTPGRDQLIGVWRALADTLIGNGCF